MDFELTDFDYYKQRQKQDKKVAGIIAGSVVVALVATLYLLGFSIPTPPIPQQLLYKDAEMELIPLENVILEEGPGGGGSGTPVEAEQSNQYVPQTEQVLTQHSSPIRHNSGNSNHTNTNQNNNNSSSSQNTSTNYFNGTGGSGGGSGSGNGSGVGNDNGPGNGSGSGNGSGGGTPKRKRISEPNTSSIESDENCKIKINAVIDASGNIVGTPTYDRNGTTTDDEALIRKVIALVKSQVRYNAVSNAANMKVSFTVSVSAN
ncbi:MAG: hypothetical protein IT221_06670 [Fluviicola sp.]|nr:hypothetical protein [Fluviicola sp.]